MKYALCLAPLALAACQGPARIVSVPPELTTCADEPDVPEIPARDGLTGAQLEAVQLMRDQVTLAWVLALRGAWGDCRAKVDGVRAWAETVE